MNHPLSFQLVRFECHKGRFHAGDALDGFEDTLQIFRHVDYYVGRLAALQMIVRYFETLQSEDGHGRRLSRHGQSAA